MSDASTPATLALGRLTVTIAGGRAEFRGRLDDGSPLQDLASKLPAGGVTLDTSGVTFVSSTGIREWVRMLRALREKGPVTLERVTDVLITQMNMYPELAREVTVLSFHAQYACPACGAERTPIVDAMAHAAELRRMQAPLLPCLECGAQMELNDFPERYLSIFRSS